MNRGDRRRIKRQVDASKKIIWNHLKYINQFHINKYALVKIKGRSWLKIVEILGYLALGAVAANYNYFLNLI